MILVPNVWGRRWWWSIKNPSMWWKGRMAASGSLGVFQTVVDSQRCKESNETLDLVSTCLNKSWHLQNFWRSQGLAMLAKLPIFINFLVDFKTFVARKKSGDLVSSGRSCMATCQAPCTGQSAELYCPVGQLGKERIPWEVYQFGVLLPFLPLQTHRIVNIVHNIQHFIETVKSCGILYRHVRKETVWNHTTLQLCMQFICFGIFSTSKFARLLRCKRGNTDPNQPLMGQMPNCITECDFVPAGEEGTKSMKCLSRFTGA